MSSLQTIKALISSVQGNELPQPYGVVQLSPQNNFRSIPMAPRDSSSHVLSLPVLGVGTFKAPQMVPIAAKIENH